MSKRSAICDLPNEEFQALLERYTMTDIGKMFGISRERIRQHRVNRGLKLGDYPSLWPLTADKLATLSQEYKGAQIARMFGVKTSTVYHYMRKYGIELKKPKGYHMNFWGTLEQRQHILDVGDGCLTRGLHIIIDKHMAQATEEN